MRCLLAENFHVPPSPGQVNPLGCKVTGSFICAGLREGVDEDDLVAQELGLLDASQMTTVQEKYKERIKQKLVEVLTKS